MRTFSPRSGEFCRGAFWQWLGELLTVFCMREQPIQRLENWYGFQSLQSLFGFVSLNRLWHFEPALPTLIRFWVGLALTRSTAMSEKRTGLLLFMQVWLCLVSTDSLSNGLVLNVTVQDGYSVLDEFHLVESTPNKLTRCWLDEGGEG